MEDASININVRSAPGEASGGVGQAAYQRLGRAVEGLTSKSSRASSIVAQFSSALNGAARSQYALIGSLNRMVGGGGVISLVYFGLKQLQKAAEEAAASMNEFANRDFGFVEERRKQPYEKMKERGFLTPDEQNRVKIELRNAERRLKSLESNYAQRRQEEQRAGSNLPSTVTEAFLDRLRGSIFGSIARGLFDIDESKKKEYEDAKAATEQAKKQYEAEKAFVALLKQTRDMKPPSVKAPDFSQYVNQMDKIGGYMSKFTQNLNLDFQLEELKKQTDYLSKIADNTQDMNARYD